MKLNKPETAAILITLLFVAVVAGYYAGSSRTSADFTIRTQVRPEPSLVLVGGDAPAPLPAEPEGGPSDKPPGSPALVNINTAGADQLVALPGIGEVLAGRIISYREENGPFLCCLDIMEVSGIGEAIYAKIEELITVQAS